MGAEEVSDDKAPRLWQPLSTRYGEASIDRIWEEGIPAWIDHLVRRWLEQILRFSSSRERVYARMRYYSSESDIGSVVGALSEQNLLDWLDAMLYINAQDRPGSEYDARALERILFDGHSVWRVVSSFGALERRQDPTATAALGRASSTASSFGRPAAAEHLRIAWAETYGMHPDPSKAFREAILAVEAVSVPVVTPKEPGAHLGHVYGQLRAQGHLYEVAIGDKSGAAASVQPVTELIGLLWHGHSDRHEGNIPAVPITQEAAEMAVHAAVVLVQWFASGSIRRKSALAPDPGWSTGVAT